VPITLVEDRVHLEFLPRLHFHSLIAEFTDDPERLHGGLRKVSLCGLFHKALPLHLEAELHRLVPVPVLCLDLRDEAGSCFNNRAGDHVAGIVEDAGHPNLLSQ
jgi:hypothetical protein